MNKLVIQPSTEARNNINVDAQLFSAAISAVFPDMIDMPLEKSYQLLLESQSNIREYDEELIRYRSNPNPDLFFEILSHNILRLVIYCSRYCKKAKELGVSEDELFGLVLETFYDSCGCHSESAPSIYVYNAVRSKLSQSLRYDDMEMVASITGSSSFPEEMKDPHIFWEEARIMIDEMEKSHTKKAKILRLYLFSGGVFTIAEIAEMYGITIQAVTGQIDSGLALLENMFLEKIQPTKLTYLDYKEKVRRGKRLFR